MQIFEVVAIRLQEGVTEPADCSAIQDLGYLAPNLNVKSADTIGKMIHRRNYWFVTVKGEQRSLEAAQSDETHYCRTLEHDSSDDPLLALPSIDEWQRDQTMEQL